MQKVNKNRRKKYEENRKDRKAARGEERVEKREDKNLEEVTIDQVKMNVGIVVLGKTIKIVQIVIKILLCIFAVLLSFLAILLHEAANWMLATWTNLSMEELVAQMKTPIQGTSHEVLWDFVETCVPAAVMAVFFVVLVIALARKTKITKWILQIGAVAGSMALIVSSAQMVWNELDVGEYLENQKTESPFIEDHYANPHEIPINFPEQKRNLIYIFMESMETTYASKDVGGGLDFNCIPELTQLAMENVNFSGTEQLGGIYPSDGATWTMGAMVAQTSGLPLKLNLRAENVSEDIEVLPGAKTLGDILGEQGYHQEILFGSDGEFAGRQQYFEKHGGYQVLDYKYAAENGWLPSPDYRVWWGYEDEKLFEFAKARLTEIGNSAQPFNFTMLTVDTHFEDGYPCRLCQDIYGEQYANVMACSSRQLVDFVRWIQQQPFYQNTTIVLVGDHLTMDSDFCAAVPEDYQRGVLNIFVNAPVEAVNTKNRVASTMDMFPTTIAALGGEIAGDRLGLGTNLFSATPTLAEEIGMEQLNAEVRKNSLFYTGLAGGMEVDNSVMDME
ncbi:MAG: LTA synthase family protein [[Ruminococcus] gnavus]|nr:LTA synthase family protein [Mediterraneibacter gnavus]